MGDEMADDNNTTDGVHKAKLRKNLAVLFLILAWCLLIFLVSIARMAKAEEGAQPAADIPAGVFADKRGGHLAHINDTAAQWQQKWQDGEAGRQEKQAALDAGRAEHAAKIEAAAGAMTQHAAEREATRASAETARDAARKAHADTMAARPDGWWQARLNP